MLLLALGITSGTSVVSSNAGFLATSVPSVSITACLITPSSTALKLLFAILFSSMVFCMAIRVLLGYLLLSSGFSHFALGS